MTRTTIHSDYIPDNAITGTKIAENSITAREIATNAITTLYVADNSVTEDKLADSINTSIAAKLPLAGGTMTGNLGVGITASSAIGIYHSQSLANGLAAEITNTQSSTGSGLVVKGGNNSSTYSADFRDYNNNSLMRVRGDGNVGIGTTSPSSELHMHVTGTSNGAQILFDSDHGTGYVGQENNTSNNLIIGSSSAGVTFYAANAEKMRLDSSGNVGIGTTNPAQKLHVTGGQARFDDHISIQPTKKLFLDGGLDTYIDEVAANTMAFHTGGGERMRIDSAGTMILQADGASNLGRIQFSSQAATYQIFGGNNVGYLGYKTGGYHRFFGSDGTEKMRIAGNGNVSIGTTTTDREFKVQKSGDSAVIAAVSGTSNLAGMVMGDTSDDDRGAVLYNNSGDYMYFQTDAAERMRILSTGEVHITSAGAAISPTIKHGGATGDNAKLRLINRAGQGADKGGILELGAVTNDGVTRSDVFAALHGGKDNATSGNKAGYLDFHTSNGSSLDRKMRLDSNGVLLIGDTALRGTIQRGQLQVTQISNSNAAGISCISGNDEISGTFCLYSSGTASAMISVDPDTNRANSAFYIHIDNAQKAVLDSGGNFTITGSYGSSDRALKENIVTLPNQLEKVKQLNPVSFDWKEKAEDGSTESSIGFVAQEVETLYPNLIKTPPTDSSAEEASTTQYKSLNYAVMVSILTKAVQELSAELDAAKARITTLEG